MPPELRGISRMTNVISPLEQLGQLASAAAEAERLRRRPWLAVAKWTRGAFDAGDRVSHYRSEVAASGSPTFLSAAVAVLLVTGAASVLSPIGSDLAANAGAKASVRSLAARTVDESPAVPAPAHDVARQELEETQPTAVSYVAADGVSPMLQVAAAYASASAVKGSRLEPTAVALTNANDVAPHPLVALAESRVSPTSTEPLYMAVLSGLPAGSRLSRGMQIGKGEWVLALDDLGSVEISVPTSAKGVAVARVEIAGQDGVNLARFPLVVDPEGRIDTETVASVAVMKNTGLPPRPAKVAARLDMHPPQPVRAKPQVKSQLSQQKETIAVTAPQQKRKVAVVRPPAPIIKPTTTANIPIDTADAEAIAAAPVGIMPEGSAGLETFRTFSLLGATDRQ